RGDRHQSEAVASAMSVEPNQYVTLAGRDAGPPVVSARRRRATSVWRALKTAPITAWFGIVVIAAYFILAIFAPLLAPYGQSVVVANQYEPWSQQFIFGTDQLGRDMLSRLIFG